MDPSALLRHAHSAFADAGYADRVRVTPADGGAAHRLDVEGRAISGSITLWATGVFEADLASEDQDLLLRSGTIGSRESFTEVLSGFLAVFDEHERSCG